MAEGNALPFADQSISQVYINNAPLSPVPHVGYFGQDFTVSEVSRILAVGGTVLGTTADAYYNYLKSLVP
jgi:hypothetical protein